MLIPNEKHKATLFYSSFFFYYIFSSFCFFLMFSTTHPTWILPLSLSHYKTNRLIWDNNKIKLTYCNWIKQMNKS